MRKTLRQETFESMDRSAATEMTIFASKELKKIAKESSKFSARRTQKEYIEEELKNLFDDLVKCGLEDPEDNIQVSVDYAENEMFSLDVRSKNTYTQGIIDDIIYVAGDSR